MIFSAGPTMRRAFATCSVQFRSPYPYVLAPVPSDPKASELFGVKFATKSQDPVEETTDPTTIIGWLKGDSVDLATVAVTDGTQIRPAQFVENQRFWPHVEQVFRLHAHEDPDLQAQAAFQKNGWMNISDLRNPPPAGRTGEPEDIVGCVLVENKVIKRGSFQPNPVHRPATSHGLFQLPKYLQARLVDQLARH
ncbi:hypothetical protein IWW38_000097 [Coemansia aciculifera]|uniref:Uncharacterized protein n=1 Tax=Coemansia aciculifera TaxID=417176 RepID=A0ACC1MA12_9FUNG|nr:hypothetical protein IWW38_000097 [Coemansia aciculifera]